MAITITLPQVDLHSWKAIQPIKCELILWEGYAQLIEKSKAESKNEDTDVWEELKVNLDLIHLKQFISGVSVLFNSKEQKDYLRIGLMGVQDDWIIYFETRKEATEVRDKILQWLTS